MGERRGLGSGKSRLSSSSATALFKALEEQNGRPRALEEQDGRVLLLPGSTSSTLSLCAAKVGRGMCGATLLSESLRRRIALLDQCSQ